MLAPWKKSYDEPRQHNKNQRYYFANKGPSSQSHGFTSSHVWMWERDHKKGWASKNWCFQIVTLEETLESPLDSKKIKQVSPKGDQHWMFIGRAEAEAPTLCPSDSFLMLGKTEGKRRRWQRMRWLDSITDPMDMNLSKRWETDSEGQGSLECCSPRGHKELDMTERMNNSNFKLAPKGTSPLA